MKFEEQEFPSEMVVEGLEELRQEVERVKVWFQTSVTSLTLIKEAAERRLTKEESLNIAKDFLVAGSLLGTMGERNEQIVRTGTKHVARLASDEIVVDFEKFMKENKPN